MPNRALNAYFGSRRQHKALRPRRFFSSYGAAMFIVFIVFSIIALLLLRNSMLNASRDAGLQLTQRISFAAVSEARKEQDFITLIANFAGQRIQIMRDVKRTPAEIELQLSEIVSNAQKSVEEMFPQLSFVFYVVYQGKMLNAVPKLQQGYDPAARPWYQQAMAQPGRAVMLDPYIDALTGRLVLTMAAGLPQYDFVLACDIYTELSGEQPLTSAIPSGYSAYITDVNGNVIFYQGAFDAAAIDPSEMRRRALALHQTAAEHISGPGSSCGSEADSDSACYFIERISMENEPDRAAYYCHDPQTNWITMITAPADLMLKDFNYIVCIFGAMIIGFALLEAWMLLREYRFSRQIASGNEALKVLGNTFRDIVRVNFRTGSFSLLKSSPYFKEQLGSAAVYSGFMQAMQKIIKPEHWQEFAREYSLQNLEHLAVNYIRDTGHDFLIFEDHSGKYVWFNVRILFDESLDVNESLISFKQVDAEKLKEIEEHQLLKDTLAISKRNEKAKNAFFANMSHDMRTPLNGILGLCQLAEHKKSAKELSDIIDRINTTSCQLLLLVDDILEVSRPEMKQSLTQGPFDLRSFIDSNLDVFRVMAEQMDRVFTISYDIVHSRVAGDSQKLRQILNNLISNSFKYSLPGCHISCLIKEVYEQEVNTKFIFEIKDDGIGMAPEFIKEVFTPYAREERKKEVVGTGLGLSIVKSFVSLMGGDIQVHSEVNVGTVFTITLPLQLQHEPEQPAPAAAAEEEPCADAAQTLAGMTVLIAEDNELNMDIACDMLELRNAAVLKAWDGQEAVEMFKKSQPFSIDVILMDMRMPKLDGCHAAMRIRALKRPDAQSVPIIAVTANAFAEDIAATHAAGMNAHVSKPIDFAIVEKTIARLTAQRRSPTENKNNKR